jgi:hypothetical protein
MAEGTLRNARLRREGTRNLVAGALAANVHRLVAQSIAWMYAPEPEPHGEDDPLEVHAAGTRAVTADGVATPERCPLPHRRSTASSCGMDIFTGRAPAPTQARCTSMRPPQPRCWRSRGRGAHLQHCRAERIPLH